VDQLKTNGKVIRGYLGLYGQDLTPDMAQLLRVEKATGVLVADVERGSPADTAGLKGQDIIQEMDGKKITSYDQFRNEIAMLKPGAKVRLSILREGKPMELTVTLGERPSAAKAKFESNEEEPQQTIGLQMQNLTRDLASQLGYSLGEGVLIVAVVPGSPASDAGLEAGDLVTAVNQQKVTTTSEFSAAMKASRKAGKALLLVRHGQVAQYVVLQFK
jgi:serine protease Do